MPSSHVRNITIDSRDPYAQAVWWAQVTGGTLFDDDQPGDTEAGVQPPAGMTAPVLLFELVPEAKELKNRIHLDLQPDTSRDEEVARLAGLGAEIVDRSHVEPDGRGWVVMRDPEGNEFCIERSMAERSTA
jgi:hypothetical protein